MEMHEEAIRVTLKMPADDFREMAKTRPVEAADALGLEISEFQDWVVGQGMEPMTLWEAQIIREYLGYKLTKKSA